MTYTYDYPMPAVTTDVIVFANGYVLLIKRGQDPYKGCWALPGGHLDVDKDFSLITCAQRELCEETGLDLLLVEFDQFRTYGDKGRDPRGRYIDVVYEVELTDMLPTKAGDDAAECQWHSINNLPPLAFDHLRILRDYLNGRNHRV